MVTQVDNSTLDNEFSSYMVQSNDNSLALGWETLAFFSHILFPSYSNINIKNTKIVIYILGLILIGIVIYTYCAMRDAQAKLSKMSLTSENKSAVSVVTSAQARSLKANNVPPSTGSGPEKLPDAEINIPD